MRQFWHDNETLFKIIAAALLSVFAGWFTWSMIFTDGFLISVCRAVVLVFPYVFIATIMIGVFLFFVNWFTD